MQEDTDTMLSKVTLKTRITVLTMIVLSLVATLLTILSNYNANRHFLTTLNSVEVDMADIYIIPRVDCYAHEMGLAAILNALDYDATMKVYFVTEQSRDDFLSYSIIVAIMVILLGTIMTYTISGHVLKPVKSLTEKIEEINANNLKSLIEPPHSKDEISRLTTSFNDMLGKLSLSFESQKMFSQNAAHELKTPLTSIMANIEVLELDDDPSKEEFKDTLDTVKSSTEKLIHLVERLLSINSTVDEARWTYFSGRNVFKKIVSELDKEIKSKNLKINIFGDFSFKGDAVLLERAYSNLIHNAVRYNVQNGTVDITISEEGIAIEDSGTGIPNEHLEHIFEPLYCVDISRSRELGGHGLGMAIAKNIFDKHNIKIRIYSEENIGTKIFLT